MFSRSWEHELDERERAFMAKFMARELVGSGDVDQGKERGRWREREGLGVGVSTGAEIHRQKQREMEAATHTVADREGGEGGRGGEAEDVRAWLLAQNEQLRDRLRKKERGAHSNRPKLETKLESLGEDTLQRLASTNTLQQRKLELVERERALKAKELDLKEVEVEEREIERRQRELDDWERALMAKELDLKGRAVLDFKGRAVSDYSHEVQAEESAIQQRERELEERERALMAKELDLQEGSVSRARSLAPSLPHSLTLVGHSHKVEVEESAIQRRERELEERERALRAKELDLQEGAGSLDRSRSIPPSLTPVAHSHEGEVEDLMLVAAALRAKELEERERALRHTFSKVRYIVTLYCTYI